MLYVLEAYSKKPAADGRAVKRKKKTNAARCSENARASRSRSLTRMCTAPPTLWIVVLHVLRPRSCWMWYSSTSHTTSLTLMNPKCTTHLHSWKRSSLNLLNLESLAFRWTSVSRQGPITSGASCARAGPYAQFEWACQIFEGLFQNRATHSCANVSLYYVALKIQGNKIL